MNDLISRQAAIDTLTRLEPSFRGSVLEQALKNMPSAQQETIRCKDCRHLLLTGGNESTGEGIYTCNVWIRRVLKGNGFCSYAERRGE